MVRNIRISGVFWSFRRDRDYRKAPGTAKKTLHGQNLEHPCVDICIHILHSMCKYIAYQPVEEKNVELLVQNIQWQQTDSIYVNMYDIRCVLCPVCPSVSDQLCLTVCVCPSVSDRLCLSVCV